MGNLCSGMRYELTSIDMQNEGHNYMINLQFERAITSYTEGIEFAIETKWGETRFGLIRLSLLHRFRGIAYENLGNQDKAVEDFNEAIKFAKEASEWVLVSNIHHTKARFYKKIEDKNNAKDELGFSIRAEGGQAYYENEGFDSAKFSLGLLNDADGKVHKATTKYFKGLDKLMYDKFEGRVGILEMTEVEEISLESDEN